MISSIMAKLEMANIPISSFAIIKKEVNQVLKDYKEKLLKI